MGPGPLPVVASALLGRRAAALCGVRRRSVGSTLNRPDLAILSWQALSEHSALGEAIVQFQVAHRADIGRPHTLVIAVNPRTATVSRAWCIRFTAQPVAVSPGELPYHIKDLAETLARERHPV